MKVKERDTRYTSPQMYWEGGADYQQCVLCQSPTSSSDLDDITIGGEEGENDGWLN